ncbi:MAG: Eco57I restriction-modification methylase domain-containing protein [Alphaproteobacteria bacterium]
MIRRGPETEPQPEEVRFLASAPKDWRRRNGITFTPPAMVAAMVGWAREKIPNPGRVVDAGAGSGRFALAAASAFPEATVIAIEREPELASLLRDTVARHRLIHRFEVREEDYRDTVLTRVQAPTLFLGNPPYVRHHALSREAKDWYATTLAGLGLPASRLAGLHLHFFLKTLTLARPGDIGCLITAAEWLDVNYGRALRQLALGPLGLLGLEVIDPRSPVFPDAMTSAVITTFEVGRASSSVSVRWHPAAESIRLGQGEPLERATLARSEKWGPLIRGGEPSAGSPRADGPTVGSLFRVSRGQVTGANRVWIVDPDKVALPREVLWPAVTRARELFAAEGILADAGRLRCVVDLPADLGSFDESTRGSIEAFLADAVARGADQGYIARHRSPWYAVRLAPPAPILCSYMARRTPVFVVNDCNARHVNIAHGLYPRRPLSRSQLLAIASFLTASASRDDGRTYAGGLVKFEPREVERLPLPHESLSGDLIV